MNTLTQIARFRQSVVTYSYNFSIKKAILHFNVSRASIYRWRKKYDGSVNSLNNLSRRPHSHPTNIPKMKLNSSLICVDVIQMPV